MAETYDDGIIMSKIYESLIKCDILCLKLYSYNDIEIFTVFVLRFRELLHYSDEEIFSFFPICKDVDRWTRFQKLSSINYEELIESIKSCKESIELASNKNTRLSVLSFEKFRKLELFDKIHHTYRIILQADYFLRVGCFDDSTSEITFSTDLLVVELADILSYASINLHNIISIPKAIFICLNLGSHGPEIAMRMLLANPPLLHGHLCELFFIMDAYNTIGDSFYEFILLITRKLSTLYRFMVEQLLNSRTLFSYAFKLPFDIRISETQLLSCIFLILNVVKPNQLFSESNLVSIQKSLDELTSYGYSIDQKTGELLIKVLMLAKYKFNYQPPSYINLLRVLCHSSKNVITVSTSVYSCLYFNQIFESTDVCNEFEIWLTSILTSNNNDSINKITTNAKQKAFQHGIKLLIVSIQVNISKSNLSPICDKIFEYFAIKVTSNELCQGSSIHCSHSLKSISDCLANALVRVESYSFDTLVLPVRNISMSSNSDYILFLSENIGSILSNHSDPFKWVIAQIFCCAKPVHVFIVSLIDHFVSGFVKTENDVSLTLCLDVLLSKIKGIELNGNYYTIVNDFTAKLLILYLILSLEYNQITFFDRFQIFQNESGQVDVIPIKNFILQMFYDQDSYNSLYSPLIFMAKSLRPHLFLPFTEQLLSINLKVKSTERSTIPHGFLNLDLCQIANSIDYDLLSDVFRYVIRLSIKNLSHFVWVISPFIKSMLNCSIPHKIKILFLKCWRNVSISSPEICHMYAAFYFLSADKESFQSLTKLHKLLVNEPHRLLDCTPKISVDPILFEMFLHTFRYYICLSRIEQSRQFHSVFAQSFASDEEELVTLFNSMDTTMDHLTIQLTIFFITRAIESHIETGSLFIMCILPSFGAFIHEFFVRNPTLIKLLHYNGYNLKAIKWMVKHVPSMHLFNGFFQGLLQDAQSEITQAFLCLVFAHLSVMYPIEQTLENVSFYVATIKMLASSNDKNVITSTIDSLIVFSKSFNFSPLVSTNLLSNLKEWVVIEPLVSEIYSPEIREKLERAFNQINQKLKFY